MSEHKIELSERDASFVADALESPKAPNEKLKDAKKSYDDAIEQEIQAKGLTAPRITPDDIEANIAKEFYITAKEFYFTGQEAVFGACMMAHGKPVLSDGESIALLTFCVLVLRNGLTVTGESACASPENFDAELCRKIARQNAVNKVWPLMGYALKEQLAQEVEWPEPSGLVLTEADAIADLNGEPRPSAGGAVITGTDALFIADAYSESLESPRLPNEKLKQAKAEYDRDSGKIVFDGESR